MDVEQQRQAIIRAYPNSKTWRQKVLKMSHSQVAAVYLRFLKDRKI